MTDPDHRVSTERRGEVLLVGLDRANKRNAFDVPIRQAMTVEMVRSVGRAAVCRCKRDARFVTRSNGTQP